MTYHILVSQLMGLAMKKSQQQLRDGFASLIARAARQWRRAVDRRLQPFGLTEATWLPLIHLAARTGSDASKGSRRLAGP